MGLVLDTCIIIAAEKQRFDFSKIIDYGEVFLTAITASELLMGVNLAGDEVKKSRRSVFVEHILNSFTILPFSVEAARVHSDVYANLKKRGMTIGAHDMLIAAIAISCGYTLLTDNYEEFSRIKTLKLIKSQDIVIV